MMPGRSLSSATVAAASPAVLLLSMFIEPTAGDAATGGIGEEVDAPADAEVSSQDGAPDIFVILTVVS
eukprot:CAMPEP_0170778838 /NCGR_PEP_ID=MMETSP0733-20121128/12629_1 /TAXON_ID=186038 /ORGANISM="Fragilariopsis kerguelensis, Strain L26-C5" /LENGTH=67 /DNA_ID=CAMNT_0011122337 /DNA_START=761 /DNA_END=964 /DNA_ORIENTATION=-